MQMLRNSPIFAVPKCEDLFLKVRSQVKDKGGNSKCKLYRLSLHMFCIHFCWCGAKYNFVIGLCTILAQYLSFPTWICGTRNFCNVCGSGLLNLKWLLQVHNVCFNLLELVFHYIS